MLLRTPTTPEIPEPPPSWFRWRVRDRVVTAGSAPLLMGILNVTPDSFSDGGEFLDPDAAVGHALGMVADGAGIIDVGGESTRPGAAAVDPDTQIARVVPVIASLADSGIAVSVDTSDHRVAAAALDAGAVAVNDVGALRDPKMAPLVAAAGAGLVLMHMLGTPRTMQDDPHYADVVAEVAGFLAERAAAAEAAGIERDRICVDPGIGFGKTAQHNLQLLNGLPQLVDLGYPVVLGTSRKRFLGTILGGAPPGERDIATAATSAVATLAGVSVLRVHNVAISAQAARIAAAIVREAVWEKS